MAYFDDSERIRFAARAYRCERTEAIDAALPNLVHICFTLMRFSCALSTGGKEADSACAVAIFV
jgi:hypothetical protein